MHKADTICKLNHFVEYVYILLLESDLIRHSVSDFSPRFFFLHDLTSEKSDTLCWLIYGVDLVFFCH